MKRETLFVDEVTKKTMDFINDGIIDSVNDVLRSTDALKTIEKLAGEISVKLNTLIKDMKKNQRELMKAISEAQSTQLQEIKSLEKKLEEIAEKQDYLSLPFYKRILKKLRNGNDAPPDINEEVK